MGNIFPSVHAATPKKVSTEKHRWDARVNSLCHFFRLSHRTIFWITFMATIFSIFASFKYECKPTSPKYEDLLPDVGSSYATFRSSIYGSTDKYPLGTYALIVPAILSLLCFVHGAQAIASHRMKFIPLGKYFSSSHPQFAILEKNRVEQALRYIKCPQDVQWSLIYERMVISSVCLYSSLFSLLFMQYYVFGGSNPLYVFLNPFGNDATQLFEHLSDGVYYQPSVNCTMGSDSNISSDVIVFICSFKCNTAFPVIFLIIGALIFALSLCHISNITIPVLICLEILSYQPLVLLKMLK